MELHSLNRCTYFVKLHTHLTLLFASANDGATKYTSWTVAYECGVVTMLSTSNGNFLDVALTQFSSSLIELASLSNHQGHPDLPNQSPVVEVTALASAPGPIPCQETQFW
eukprot:sb/3477294/